MKTIEFEVTQEDINGASRGKSLKCVIARALKRTFGYGFAVGVDSIAIGLTKSKNPTTWSQFCDNPPNLQYYIRTFDLMGRAHPTKFSIVVADSMFEQLTQNAAVAQ